MLGSFAIGAFLGAVTGVPIGPVNVAVIDAAYRHSLKRALGVATGGALADALVAYVGFSIVGPFIQSNALIPPILYLCSGIALVTYGIVTVRSQKLDATSSRADEPAKSYFGGVMLGALLICLNPAALITWTVIVGPILTSLSLGIPLWAALGVGVGSMAWFGLVAFLSHKGKNVLGSKMMWITRVVGILLIAYGLFSIVRGIIGVVALF